MTIPPHNPANQGKSTALKTMSAPKPDHIYDRPEGRDQGPVTLRPDVARSYAISGPLDDRAQPPSKAVHAPAKQHRRSTGDIQISELDDILNSLEVSRNDLGKLEEQSNGTVNNTPRFYDRPEHVEKSKGRDRSMSLNQRPTPNVHDVSQVNVTSDCCFALHELRLYCEAGLCLTSTPTSTTEMVGFNRPVARVCWCQSNHYTLTVV